MRRGLASRNVNAREMNVSVLDVVRLSMNGFDESAGLGETTFGDDRVRAKSTEKNQVAARSFVAGVCLSMRW